MRSSQPAFASQAACLAALACLVLPGWAAGAADDEVVPEGIVHVRLSLLLENQDTALDQSGQSGALKNYVVPDLTLRDEIEGSISRKVTRYDLRTTYGLSESWNLSLNVPFVEVKQTSTLAGAAGASADALALVDQLQSQTITGIGDVELTTLFRPRFSDWNAFTWGYGLILPGKGQQSPYVGAPTLQLGEPTNRLFSFAHYTRYPAAPRSRFDLRLLVLREFGHRVIVTGGEARQLEPNFTTTVKAGWTQELGDFLYGFGGEYLAQGEHTVSGEGLGDPVRANIFRFQIGYGNLRGLETGPLAFPYQVRLELRSVDRGANVPNGDHFTLSILSYF